jgi:hypothetical protein
MPLPGFLRSLCQSGRGLFVVRVSGGSCPPTSRRVTTTHYLLSVHGEPMTDEEMAQSHQQLGVLEQELKSAGALDLDNHHPYHATRADLLGRLGRHREATVAYQRAAALAPTKAERDFLRRGGRASRSADR